MQVADIKALKRTELGSRHSARLRHEGFIPAVIYGGKAGTTNLRISEWEIDQHIRNHHKVYRVDVEGQKEAAFLKDVQFDALTDRPLHVDFLRIDMKKPISVAVEISWIGHPPGASRGGVLVKDMNELMIRCLPTAIPEVIEVHVSKVDLGDTIHAREVELPDGVELDIEPEAVVCHMPGEVVHAEPEPEPAEAGPSEPEVIGAGGSEDGDQGDKGPEGGEG